MFITFVSRDGISDFKKKRQWLHSHCFTQLWAIRGKQKKKRKSKPTDKPKKHLTGFSFTWWWLTSFPTILSFTWAIYLCGSHSVSLVTLFFCEPICTVQIFSHSLFGLSVIMTVEFSSTPYCVLLGLTWSRI